MMFSLSWTRPCLNSLMTAEDWNSGLPWIAGFFVFVTSVENRLGQASWVSELSSSLIIALTNWVGGPYSKLRITFFPYWMDGQSAKHEEVEKTKALTYSTDRDNEVSKMLVIFLEIESSRKAHHEVKRLRTLECRPLNQPITAHVVPE